MRAIEITQIEVRLEEITGEVIEYSGTKTQILHKKDQRISNNCFKLRLRDIEK